MYRLPIARLKRVDQAFNELDAHLLALVRARRAALASGADEGRLDLFGSLLLAGKEDDGEEAADGEKVDGSSNGAGKPDGSAEGLTDREVLGNTFIFLLAGHETSGHTLAFVFALLALHPEAQQKLHDHVASVLPDGQQPVRPFVVTASLAIADNSLCSLALSDLRRLQQAHALARRLVRDAPALPLCRRHSQAGDSDNDFAVLC